MKRQGINILIADSSYIIQKGLPEILYESVRGISIEQVNSIDGLKKISERKDDFDIIFINPSLIVNKKSDFNTIKKSFNNSTITGIIYSIFSKDILDQFDSLIYINDSPEMITNTIKALCDRKNNSQKENSKKFLSDREIDVLKLLTKGNSHKEIAYKLNISTHTVVAHRKNISQKTGIKTVSGLTIYAIINKIINIEE